MGHESRGRNVEQDLGRSAPVREHAEPPVGFVIFLRDDTLGHLALEHQHHHVVPRRPRLDREPADQQRGRDVVGQVGDDFRLGAAEQRPRIESLRVGVDDIQPSRITSRNRLKRGQRACVVFDGDDTPRAQRQQRPRQPAGARPDLDNGRILKRTCGARDPRGQVEVQQEVLAQRFAGRERVLANDLAQRWKVVDRAHDAQAMRAASRNAAIRLAGLARPLPAISKAVP